MHFGKGRAIIITFQFGAHNTSEYGGLAQLVRAPASHAGGLGFESLILHHTVRTRTRFFMKKGSGTFFVYRRFCGRTTQSVKRAKAGYHYDGGVLPFALRNQVRFVRTWSSPYMTHWGQSLCTCVPGERVHLWQGVTHRLCSKVCVPRGIAPLESLRSVYARTQENGKISLYRGVLSWRSVVYSA